MGETARVRSVITLLVASALTALADPSSRRPVLAYWVSHHDQPPMTGRPWSETSGLPNFVLYDDGLVVLTSSSGESVSTTLTEAERTTAFPVRDFFDLKDSTTGTNELHPPVHVLTRWNGPTRKTVRFFGTLEQAAPPGLAKALHDVASYKPASSSAYVPERLVVRACTTKAAPKSQKWPEGWAAPGSGVKDSVLTDCFTHVLPASERRRAEALVPRGQSFTTIASHSATWLVTLARFALPAEEAWAGR